MAASGVSAGRNEPYNSAAYDAYASADHGGWTAGGYAYSAKGYSKEGHAYAKQLDAQNAASGRPSNFEAQYLQQHPPDSGGSASGGNSAGSSSSGGGSVGTGNSAFDQYMEWAKTRDKYNFDAQQNQYNASNQATHDAWDINSRSAGNYADSVNASAGAAWNANRDSDMAYWNANTGTQRDRYDSLLHASGAAGRDQINQARGRYDNVNNFYNDAMRNGGISNADEQARTLSAYNDIATAAQAQSQGLNAGLASRGLGSNVGASAALGLQGAFQAAGARGHERADIARERESNRFQAASGAAGVAGNLAGLDTMTSYEDQVGRINNTALPSYAPAPHYDNGPNVYRAPDVQPWQVASAPSYPDYTSRYDYRTQYDDYLSDGGTAPPTAEEANKKWRNVLSNA